MAEKPAVDLNLEQEIDRLVHEPARLKILAFLSLLENADFTFLVSRLGLKMGNLSAHLSKLEEAGASRRGGLGGRKGVTGPNE